MFSQKENKNMKKSLPIIIVILIIVGFGVWWQLGKKETPPVTSFEECVAAGNPVMESYPRQCRHGDQTFTEIIVETFTQTKGPVSYSIDIPFGWFPHENGSTVIFTQDPTLDIPQNTEGFAIGPNIYITVSNITDIEGVTTYEGWLNANGMTEKSELFIEKKPVTVNGLEMFRIRTEGAGVAGEVLHYVYFVDVQHVVTLSQFPYDPDSNITQVFENAVQTFYVPERQGGEGILPFNSGVTGKVLLGPTCPVMKDPPDPGCADKPFQTTVQVIAIGSPKSSPFSTAKSDKDGTYKVILPPGEYGLQAVGNIPFPRCETKNITVEPNVMHEVNLSCDTGIR
jgi:hypothetical protein